jgi:hypothetical protein
MKNLLKVVFVLLVATRIYAESNDAPETLKDAEAKVQAKLQEFSKTNRYELLLDARKLASSMNSRGDKATLSMLDEGSLRLQLKVLLALAKARDPHYDHNAPTNSVYLNLVPPLPDSGVVWPSGVDPKVIKDPKARKAYEDAIAENHRRNEKLKREMSLSRGVDYAVIDIWVFVMRGFSENTAARKSAIEIIEKSVSDKTILNRLKSDSMPGSTW